MAYRTAILSACAGVLALGASSLPAGAQDGRSAAAVVVGVTGLAVDAAAAEGYDGRRSYGDGWRARLWNVDDEGWRRRRWGGDDEDEDGWRRRRWGGDEDEDGDGWRRRRWGYGDDWWHRRRVWCYYHPYQC